MRTKILVFVFLVLLCTIGTTDALRSKHKSSARILKKQRMLSHAAEYVYAGFYTLYNRGQQKYLQAQNGVVTGSDTPRLWQIREHDDNTISLQDTVSNQYLRQGNNEVNSVGHNYSWEKWILIKKDDMTYCLKNNVKLKFVQMYNSNGYHVRRADTCSTESEVFVFTRQQQLQEGTYRIISNQWNVELAQPSGDAVRGVTNGDYWKIVQHGNAFSFQSLTHNKYLRCGTNDEINAVGHNQAWERWIVYQYSEGVYCVINQHFGKYLRMYQQDGEYRLNHQTYCGGWERYRFEAVNQDFEDGYYVITNKQWNQHLVNTQSDVIRGKPEEDIWRVINEGNGVYALQSQKYLNHLRAGSAREINAVAHNQGWEKWKLYRREDGYVCIYNIQFGTYVRMRQENGHYLVDQQDWCKAWEFYIFTRIESYSGMTEGRYRIINNQWNVYLANGQGDKMIGSLEPTIWRIVREGEENLFSLQDESTNNYLRCGNAGEINAVGHNLGWEKWYLEQQQDGLWCIVNKQFGKFVRMYQQNGGYLVNQQTYCAGWEKYRIEEVVEPEVDDETQNPEEDQEAHDDADSQIEEDELLHEDLLPLCFNDDGSLASEIIPIYRYWKSGNSDHFYTWNADEIGTTTPGQTGNYGYKSEGIAFYLFKEECQGSAAVHRYWKASGGDHFYTTNANEIGTTTPQTVGNYGYTYEGVLGYAIPENDVYVLPVYRYWKSAVTDHFYTLNSNEIGTTTPQETGNYGYKSEGVGFYSVDIEAVLVEDEEDYAELETIGETNGEITETSNCESGSCGNGSGEGPEELETIGQTNGEITETSNCESGSCQAPEELETIGQTNGEITETSNCESGSCGNPDEKGPEELETIGQTNGEITETSNCESGSCGNGDEEGPEENETIGETNGDITETSECENGSCDNGGEEGPEENDNIGETNGDVTDTSDVEGNGNEGEGNENGEEAGNQGEGTENGEGEEGETGNESGENDTVEEVEEDTEDHGEEGEPDYNGDLENPISEEDEQNYQEEVHNTITQAGYEQIITAHSDLGKVADDERSQIFEAEYPHDFDVQPTCTISLGGFLVLPGAKVGLSVQLVSTDKHSFKYKIVVPPGAAVQVVKINYIATERRTMSFGNVKISGEEVSDLKGNSITKDVDMHLNLNNPRAFAGISGFYADGNTDNLHIGVSIDHANVEGATVSFMAGPDTNVYSLEAVVVAYEETGFQNVLAAPLSIDHNPTFAQSTGDRSHTAEAVLGSAGRNYVGFFAFRELNFDLDEKLRLYENHNIDNNKLEVVFSTRYTTKIYGASGTFFYAHN